MAAADDRARAARTAGRSGPPEQPRPELRPGPPEQPRPGVPGQPRPGVPVPAPVAQPRARIVLAEVSRREDRAERTRTELAQQTRVGDALVRGLVRAQLALALRLSLVVAIGLGGLPWLFAIAPDVGRITVLGVNLPWLLLGVVSFPFLIAVGWAYVRLAERNEQDFTDLVQRPER